MGDELRVEGVGDHTDGFMFNLKLEHITPSHILLDRMCHIV